MCRTLTPTEYHLLQVDLQDNYAPEYKEYVTKRVRTYFECDCCSHREFTGWGDETKPVGKPVRYVLLKGMDSVMHRMSQIYAKKFMEGAMQSNFILGRIPKQNAPHQGEPKKNKK